jgi:acyl carrier protein
MSSDLIARVCRVVCDIVPQASAIGVRDAERTLCDLGFDSMAMISLFVVLEEEFQLSVTAMASCLHKGCTLDGVLKLCSDAALC